jgi:hypothetical protein
VQTVRGDKGTQEIPVPDVKLVANYADDVKPNYVIPDSYVRFTGNNLVSPEFTPYDLDSEVRAPSSALTHPAAVHCALGVALQA